MDQDLNSLDLGISRFLEHNFILVWKIRIDLEQFRAAADALLLKWPPLDARLDFLRTSLLPPNRKDPARYVWKGKTSDQRIDEMAELPQQGEDVQLLDPTSLERLVDFGYGFGWHLRQDILAIRTVVLRDACVVGFKLQHSFGDANAMMKLAKAYCALVDGTVVGPASFVRPPLKVKSGVRLEGERQGEATSVHPISKLHAESSATDWASFLKSSWRQKARVFMNSSSRRIPKTLFIPRRQINKWINETQGHNARVTEHDLILSFLYRHFANDDTRSPNLGITMNVQRQLQNDAGFGNPWILMPVPPYSEAGETGSLGVALHIRHTINSAKDPVCISQIIGQHASLDGKPMIPRHFAARDPHFIVTSWAGHAVYEYELGTKTPVAVHGNVAFCGYLRKTGMIMDDLLVVWKSKDGYWIHGCLENGLWEQMAQSLK
ncbi:hypothetical protein N7465_010124 [Penicillium sp. CMV-2018d]|nr:hypothetical protein N7465_010124 [Penicillium sp. CMV-2018d]